MPFKINVMAIQNAISFTMRIKQNKAHVYNLYWKVQKLFSFEKKFKPNLHESSVSYL